MLQSEQADDDLIDTVDEEEYKKIVKARLERDDFIEDDDGSGYVDDGREVWHDDDRDEGMDSEDEEDRRKRRGTSSRSRDLDESSSCSSRPLFTRPPG